jgi:diguanylate cyclase (GGDEF)-like protein
MKRNSKELILLSLSALAFLSIFPFALYRFYHAQWLIGFVDLFIAVGMAIIFHYVYNTREFDIPSYILAVFSAIAAAMSINTNGTDNIYWAYPAIVAFYYLMPYKWAIRLTVLLILSLVHVLYISLIFVIFASIITTLLMTAMFGFIFAKNVQDQHQQLTNLVVKDSLTGCGNRRALDSKLAELIVAQVRKPSKISMIMLDLDLFKSINDKYGHVAGDKILIRVVQIIEARIRMSDSLYRYGGEEFVILPIENDLESTTKLAEQIRALIEFNELAPEGPATISIGVAEYINGESSEDWLSRTDKALYQAKQSGRNKVCIASHPQQALKV